MYSSWTRENSLSSDATYEGDRSNVGGIEASFEVGGRVTFRNDGSKWEEYDSRATPSSALHQYTVHVI